MRKRKPHGELPLERIDRKIDYLIGKVKEMAISQEQFDSDLAALVGAIDNLIIAVDNALSSKPAADLTAEDQAVQDAAKKVSDEIAKLTPAEEPPPTG